MVDFYGKLVGKYTSPMDPYGIWGQGFLYLRFALGSVPWKFPGGETTPLDHQGNTRCVF